MDRMYYICERELYILKALDDLEKSYKGSKVTTDEEELRAHLDLNFDIEKYKELARYTKKALDGPLGDYFYDARRDFLIKFAFYIWKKYLMSSLHQIETLYELRLTEELSDVDFRKYESILNAGKLSHTDMLESISKILQKTDSIDPIWLIKINVELCKLLEEQGEFRKASQICRFAYNKLIEFKDKWFQRGVESKRDVFLPMTITCNNIEIHKMIEEMKARYADWKTWLRKEVRAQNRQKNGKKALEDDEATEEDYEFIDASRVFFGVDSLKDHKNLDSFANDKAFNEYLGTINSLHTDVVANLLRLEIKAGKQSHKASKLKQTDKFVTTLKNSEGIDSIPERLKARLNIMSGATTIQIKKNVTNLQTTLQNAGKLEPPKPKVSKYEEILLKEGSSNSYFNALLHMTMAGNKSKFPEQKYLLNESMKYIKQAEEEEATHIRNGIENAPFVFSTLLDDRNAEITADDFYPFNYLYKPEFIRETQVPPKPVLISRSTSTITLKIPPFNPVIPELYLLENPALKIVNLMSIYGKVSQNGVDVSLTSTDLQNTGVRLNNGAVVTITNLTINDKYCFASAGFNPQEKVINGIGKTSEDIACVLPLPINLLYAYLAQNAYQIGYFELAEEASELSGAFFCEKTNIKERSLDYADNPIYMYRIKSEAVKNFSLTELRVAAMNYIVHARCLQRAFDEQDKSSRNPILYLTKQRNALVVCNYLMLALECASITKSYPLAKRIVKEIYNDVLPFLSFRTKSKFIFQILIKAQLLISQIPKEIWDGALRTASIKITYEILKMTLQFNEIRISKLLLYYDSRLPHRKWFIVSKTIMVEENLIIESKDPKDKKAPIKDDKSKKPTTQPTSTSKAQPANSQTETLVTTKLVPKIIRELLNKATYQDNLEEFLLSLGEEYFDSVMGFIDFWKEQLEVFKPFIDNGPEIIDKKRSELSLKFEFWDSLRDQAQAFNKVKAYSASPYFMEFICKYFKKYMEKGFDLKVLVEQFKTITETNTDCIQLVNKIRDLKLRAIEGDIGWNPNMLEELITEREINKQGEDLAIEIYTEFWKLDQDLKDKSQGDSQYLYDLKWLGEFNLIKASALYILLLREAKTEPENRYEVFFDVTEVEPERIFQPIEVQNMDNQQQVRINKARVDQLLLLFKYLANAATYFCRARTYNLLQNLAKFSLNIMKVEMLTPYDHQGSELYKYITLMCENFNEMLEHLKSNMESERKSTRGGTFNPVTPSIVIEEHKADDALRPSNTKNYLLDTYLTKDYWFIGQEIDVQTVANNVSYCIKTLSVESKWRVIVECSKHFCNVTVQYYSIFILPFTEYAQKMLYETAKAKTNKKRDELDARRKLFETWKNNQKRKRRADQLTGKVPQEQLDYERDEAELNKQIDIHKRVEDFLDNDRARSAELLRTIRRDENQALENLNQWRKLLVKYGNDRKELNNDIKKINDPQELKLREKATDMLYRTVVPKYKEVIEILKKKQENFALVQALHERGNVYYSVGEYKKFMQDWNESLDTIFQRFNSLKTFREIFPELSQRQPLAFALGVPSCLIGSILLHKLGQYGYYAEIYNQMECSLMAYELVFAIFRISMPHQLIAISYGAYRIKELLQNEDLFTNKFVLNPADLIVACNYHANFLIDLGQYIKALPFLALMEYLAIDITQSNYYSMKAKLLKVVCLAHSGYINEAYQILTIASQEKDLPLGFVKASEYAKKDAGYNFSPAVAPYFNECPPYDEKNKDIVEFILNLSVNPKFKFKYGFINHNLFSYAKSCIIYSVYEVENYDRQDDNRMIRLNRAQETLRSVLKRLAFEEDFMYLKEKYARIEREGVAAAEGGDPKVMQAQQLGYLKQAMTVWMEANDVDDTERDDHFAHRESGLQYSEVREERITLMLRIRYLLSLMNNSLNFSTRAYHIVKFAIQNLFKLSEDQRRIETGDEPGVIIEEVKSDDPKKKGDKKKEEEKKDKKDDKKDDKKKQQAKKGEVKEDELPPKTEEELAKEFEEDLKLLKKESNSRKTRTVVNGFWWLKLRTQFALILLKQNKYSDCLELVKLFKIDSKNLKDTYFVRIFEEIEAKVLIKTGFTVDGLRKIRNLIQHGNTYFHHDLAYGNIIGDFADALYEKGDIDEAEQNYKLARDVFNNLLHEIRFEFRPQNTNQAALSEDLKVAGVLQIPLETESLIMRTDKFKMKKDEKKAVKDDKKKVDPKAKGKPGAEAEQLPEYEIQPLDALVPYDFTKENKGLLPAIEEAIASNKLPFVYTIKIYEAYIKASLYYVRCLLWKNDDWDQETIFKILDDVTCIIQNLYSTPVSLKFLLNLFYGKALKRKFILEFKKIHNVYLKKLFEEKNKKYRKLSQKVPHRDLLRNQYMIEIPNFSEELKSNLGHVLEQSREYLAKATDLLKNECLLFESGIKCEEAFVELSQVCVYLREYRPRISYKYQTAEDLRAFHQGKTAEEIKDFEKHIDDSQKTDQKVCYELEWHAYSFLAYSIQIAEMKMTLEEKFATLFSQPPLQDQSKVPQDIHQAIIESDYQQKKTYGNPYNVKLFDESKKKKDVNYIDLVLYLNRLCRESNLFTFSNSNNQRIISKLHRFLKATHPAYQKNILLMTGAPPRTDQKTFSLSEGYIIGKIFENPRIKEHRLMYMLGPLNKAAIKHTLPADEFNKILLNEESEVLYGILYFGHNELSEFLQSCYDLKTAMELSEKASKDVRDRDYKYHRETFAIIIAKFAQKFYEKDELAVKSTSGNQSPSNSSTSMINEDDPLAILGKHVAFIPDLTMDSIYVLIALFGTIGLNVQNHNYLVLMRFFHKMKYK